MSRDFQINGECLVTVKSRVDSAIGALTQLGLTADPVQVGLNFRHRPINLDAWGGEVPAEIQFMLAMVTVTVDLIHFDRSVLDECLRLSMAGAPAVGQLSRAGSRMGNNLPRFAAGNNFIGLNLTSPVGGKPWRFIYAYMVAPPFTYPLGTEKSIVRTAWEVIPFTQDPWNGGLGAQGQVLWDYTLDT